MKYRMKIIVSVFSLPIIVMLFINALQSKQPEDIESRVRDFDYSSLPVAAAEKMRRNANKTTLPLTLHAGAPTQQLHDSLLVADMHCDLLLWNSDFNNGSSAGHVDLPKLLKGRFLIETFSVATTLPAHFDPKNSDRFPEYARRQGWPQWAYADPFNRALFMAGHLKYMASHSGGKFRIIYNSSDLKELVRLCRAGKEIVGALLSMEGAYPIGNDLSRIDLLYRTGFRMISPAHFYDSTLSGSTHTGSRKGLSALGIKALEAMERLGMIIDCSHLSPEAVDDLLRYATRPVVASHTGVRALKNIPRNLSDSQIRSITSKGGIIGAGFWPEAAGGNDLQAIVRTIRHIVTIGGVEHVALGTDFDGMVSVPVDASGMALLTEALMKDGFSDTEIRLIMGENLVRFYRDQLR
jgi:microsomal dipeptidase-like Zn-dependent dipeptidase